MYAVFGKLFDTLTKSVVSVSRAVRLTVTMASKKNALKWLVLKETTHSRKVGKNVVMKTPRTRLPNTMSTWIPVAFSPALMEVMEKSLTKY